MAVEGTGRIGDYADLGAMGDYTDSGNTVCTRLSNVRSISLHEIIKKTPPRVLRPVRGSSGHGGQSTYLPTGAVSAWQE